MVVYASNTGTDPDPEIPLSMGRRFGVHGLNHNWLADETGLTIEQVRKFKLELGYTDVWNQDGGMIGWKQAGYPLLDKSQ